MALNQMGFAPRLTFLSKEDTQQIFNAALTLIETLGMTVMHDAALGLLQKAGCRADADGNVKIPGTMVTDAIERAPRRIVIYDRQGDPAMDLGGRRAYFGTGSDLMYQVDSQTFERRQTGLEDVCRAARVFDALEQIDFVMTFAFGHELPASRAFLEGFKAMVEHTTKPVVNTAACRDDLSEMWEISKIIRGGEAALRGKPFWIQYTEPISPLKHPYSSLDKLLFCARTGMPVVYSPAPIAGSTAPMTIAGHVAQGIAETLFGLVIHQLAAPGAPFLMGMGPAVLDMVTGQCSYNAPEYLMAYMAVVEVSNYLVIPNWGYAGTTDSQVPDQQATYEAGLLTFMSAMAGSNLNHDVGYLNFGLTGSLEMVVILDEVIAEVRRMQLGIPIDDVQIGLDVIREGRRSGEFLTHPHTLAHVRATQWRPKLLSRKGYDQWETEGRATLLDRARRRLMDILAGRQSQPMAEQTLRDINARVARFQP